MARRNAPRGRKPKQGRPPPKCKAILLCDSVIIDAMTGKVSLVGIFETFNLLSLPGRTVPAQIFLQLTDAQGKYALKIEVHDLQEDAIMARGGGIEIEFQNKLQKTNAWFPMPALPIKHEGTYDLVVFSGNLEIDRQQFQVKLLIPPKPESANDET